MVNLDDYDILDSNDIKDSGAPPAGLRCSTYWEDQIFCDSEDTEYVPGIENPLVLAKSGAKTDMLVALRQCDSICMENPGITEIKSSSYLNV